MAQEQQKKISPLLILIFDIWFISKKTPHIKLLIKFYKKLIKFIVLNLI